MRLGKFIKGRLAVILRGILHVENPVGLQMISLYISDYTETIQLIHTADQLIGYYMLKKICMSGLSKIMDHLQISLPIFS